MGIINQIANLIFPALCKQCGASISADTPTACFCLRCWDSIKWFDGPCCPQCGMPYPSLDPASHSPQTHAGHICVSCHKNPPSFDKAIPAGPYEGVLAEAIKLFKYKKKVHIGRALVERMASLDIFDKGVMGGLESCYIIPVPLHSKRLQEREFNQSAIIASELGKRLEIPLLLDVLVRPRYTMPQVELNMKEREENVTGAFGVQSGDVIAGKDIILVDDVYTTGSTVNECAKVLKKNGAGMVYVVTIARMVG